MECRYRENHMILRVRRNAREAMRGGRAVSIYQLRKKTPGALRGWGRHMQGVFCPVRHSSGWRILGGTRVHEPASPANPAKTMHALADDGRILVPGSASLPTGFSGQELPDGPLSSTHDADFRPLPFDGETGCIAIRSTGFGTRREGRFSQVHPGILPGTR